MQTIWGKPVFDSLAEIIRPEHTALVVVDMQNDFCHPDGYYGQNGKPMAELTAAVEKMNLLVSDARQARTMVVWIQQTLLPHAQADSPAWLRRRTGGTAPPEWTLAGTWGQEFVSPLQPEKDEAIVVKHRSSAFVGTSLDLLLRANGIKSLVIGGAVTQGCVESTARDATFFDYYVVLATDCVSTIDSELHEASMRCQASRYDFADRIGIQTAWTSEIGENS